MTSKTSTSPRAWLGYYEEVDGEMDLVMFEGEYPDVHTVEPEECVGVEFTMDELEFEIVGDLAGHVAYRRKGTAAVYNLSWVAFEERIASGTIEIKQ